MNMHFFENMSRRDFLKYSLATVAALTIPGSTGCSTIKMNSVPEVDNAKDIELSNCNLVDVIKGAVIPDARIKIRNGKIVNISKGKTKKKSSATVIDLNGKYITPGLIDLHCHITVVPIFTVRSIDVYRQLRQQKNHFIATLKSGVTTIRDVGSFPPIMQHLSNNVEEGDLKGPRSVFCNSMMNIKGGHPEMDPSDVNIFAQPASLVIGDLQGNFENMEHLKELLIENSEKASFVKITVDRESVFCKTDAKIPVYSKSHLKEIFGYAEKKNLPVACHCMSKWGFDRITDYPVHSLEHMVPDAILSDKDAMKLKERNIAVVPTMAISQSYLMEEAYDTLPAKFDDEFIRNELEIRRKYLQNIPADHIDPEFHDQNIQMLKQYKKIGYDKLWENDIFLVNPEVFFNMMKNGRKNLLKFRDAGVLMGLGMDAGMPFTYFGGIYRELELLSRIGFKNDEIIRIATINGAKILKMEDTIGSINTGKLADLLVLDKNPLRDITTFRKPQLVFKEGKIEHSVNKLKPVNGILTVM